MLRFTLPLAILLQLPTGTALAADIQVKEAWVRGTVAGQRATGAYMEILSKSGAVLVGAATPAAEVTEVHEMKMEGGVMQMRAVPRLELPAGKAVQLQPGGYHLMLLKLRQPMQKGDSVPLTLMIEGRDRKVEPVEVSAEVRDLTSASPSGGHQHPHHH